MTEAPPLSKIVEDFAAGVQAACALLDTFQPDLVLVMMHSGIAPLRVTQALWETTRDVPFPPVVATNIGREKSEYYLDLPEHQGDHTFWFDICSGGWNFVGWAVHETDWAMQLARQITSSLPQGFTPQRVLILDDWAGYSVTQRAARCLTVW